VVKRAREAELNRQDVEVFDDAELEERLYRSASPPSRRPRPAVDAFIAKGSATVAPAHG